MLFDSTNFNGNVFDALVRSTPNLRLNQLIKSGAIVKKNDYAAQLPDAKGGHFITTVIKERIGGSTTNYDGNTDITASSRGNYTMGRIVVGRAAAWTDKDFQSDISGDDYKPAAGEVAEYWDDVDQDALIATLKGIFSMTGAENLKFVNGHTYDISKKADGNVFDATTLNTGMQQALGDNKAKFALSVMHSKVATNLENLKVLEYMKYTDENGIERTLTLATLNGRIVLVDDTMPTTDVAATYTNTTDTALVSGKTYYTKSGSTYTAVASPDVANIATYYEMTDEAHTEYTTYVLGNGAIELTECAVKTPSEMEREALKNGGETTLATRQRKIYAPYGISWKTPSIVSPTDEQLAAGANWEVANSNESGTAKYYPVKAIAIARIITRG